MTMQTMSNAMPPGVAWLFLNRGHAASKTPLMHKTRLIMVIDRKRCPNISVAIRLMRTGLVAMASEPKPADTCCMASTYKPKYNEMFSKPYIASCSHSFFCGRRLRKTPCAISSINKPAIKKRIIQITKGWATCKPILVATAADGHSIENPNPVKNHNQPADFLLFPGPSFCFNACLFW